MTKDIQFWQNHVEAQARSGISKKAYCANENLVYTTFIGWNRRLSKKKNLPDFIEVKPFSKEHIHKFPEAPGRILIKYNKQNGFQIELNLSLNTLERFFSR